MVLARWHVVNVKFRFAAGRLGLPGVGHRVVAVGLLSRGSVHTPEVDVQRTG